MIAKDTFDNILVLPGLADHSIASPGFQLGQERIEREQATHEDVERKSAQARIILDKPTVVDGYVHACYRAGQRKGQVLEAEHCDLLTEIRGRSDRLSAAGITDDAAELGRGENVMRAIIGTGETLHGDGLSIVGEKELHNTALIIYVDVIVNRPHDGAGVLRNGVGMQERRSRGRDMRCGDASVKLPEDETLTGGVPAQLFNVA